MVIENESDQANGLKSTKVEPNGVTPEDEKGLDLQEIMRKVFIRPTRGHLKSLDELYESALPSVEYEHEPRVFSIILVVQRILEEGFDGGITVHKFGSFLTGLHSFGNESDLNLELFDKAFEILENANVSFIRKQVTKRSDWLLPSIGFFASFPDVQISVNCCLGPIARRAWNSSKLVLAYVNLWPTSKHLALFVRNWAKLLKLNSPCYAGVSNYMFDLMVVHYLQQTGYLPVLNQVLRDDFHEEMHGLPVLQLVEMETTNMMVTCKQISELYYGEKIPKRSVGSLIYGFFRYFAAEFDMGTMCQITQRQPMEKDDRRMRNFFVKDPFTDKNVAKFRSEIFAYFQCSMVFAARYLCMPHTPQGPIYNLKFQAHFDNGKAENGTSNRCVVSDRNNLEPPSADKVEALLKNCEDYVNPLLFAKHNFTNNLEPPVHCYICGSCIKNLLFIALIS
uniref:PAP-associated domain-containing protein n=1 Tax=Ditylenchus dipsaci TaxID=166011 RepID=A0A915CRJ0_9BILA